MAAAEPLHQAPRLALGWEAAGTQPPACKLSSLPGSPAAASQKTRAQERENQAAGAKPSSMEGKAPSITAGGK